jgi:uncharacterized protein (DUF342 family)
MTNEIDNCGVGLVLEYDAVARAVIASFSPTAISAPIDEVWLMQALAAQGWADLRVLQSPVNILLSAYNQGTAVAALRVAEVVDAQFTISLSADAMQALFELQVPKGGNPLTKEAVLLHLAGMGISEGIDLVAIDEALAAGTATGVAIAHGTLPQHGADGYLERLLPNARSRTPRVDDSGQVDYRDLGDILVVKPGDPLMRRHPPIDGISGRNLLGAQIPARSGKVAVFASVLNGAEISADDPDLLAAAINGQPVEIPGGMMVEPVFTVPAVSMASGNINFDGTVSVKGDVAKGMSVKATGDIEVDGVVEMASLEAGGDIVIKGGVIGALGKKDAASHSIRCGHHFVAGYTQNVRIESGDTIEIRDTAIQCELIAVNCIVVGSKGRGSIVGGHHQATLSVRAKQIGSPQRAKTHIEIGVNPAMHKHLLELAKRRDGSETQLLELSKLLDFASKNPGRIPPDKRVKAIQMAKGLAQDIATLRSEQEVLNHKIALSMGARVIALEHIFEGVEVQLGNKRFRVPSEFGAVAVGLNERGDLGLLVVDEPPHHP